MEGLPARVEDRYTAFLNSTRSKSSQSVKDVEQSRRYQQLEQAYEDANETARPRTWTNYRNRSRDLSAKILAVRTFSPTAAPMSMRYLRASKPKPARPARRASKRTSTSTRKKKATVEFPDGHKQQLQLPRTGRNLQRAQKPAHQAERGTGRSAQAGHRGQQQDVRLSSPTTWWTSRPPRLTA